MPQFRHQRSEHRDSTSLIGTELGTANVGSRYWVTWVRDGKWAALVGLLWRMSAFPGAPASQLPEAKFPPARASQAVLDSTASR